MGELSGDFKERAEAFMEGAIGRVGVVDHIPRDAYGLGRAENYVTEKINGLDTDRAYIKRGEELLGIIADVRFAEVAYRNETPEEAKGKIGFSKEWLANATRAEDEKFRRWKASRITGQS